MHSVPEPESIDAWVLKVRLAFVGRVMARPVPLFAVPPTSTITSPDSHDNPVTVRVVAAVNGFAELAY